MLIWLLFIIIIVLIYQTIPWAVQVLYSALPQHCLFHATIYFIFKRDGSTCGRFRTDKTLELAPSVHRQQQQPRSASQKPARAPKTQLQQTSLLPESFSFLPPVRLRTSTAAVVAPNWTGISLVKGEIWNSVTFLNEKATLMSYVTLELNLLYISLGVFIYK